VDVIVRGEGDLTMRELVRAVEAGAGFDGIAGISFRRGAAFVRNPDRHVSHLDAEVLPPRRSARVLSGYTFLGRPIDVVETSRGCTYDCSFCSIIEMRGRNFHVWPIARVIDDIRDARSRGARAVFIVDDNITLNVTRFKALCEAIIAADLADIHYIVQGMTSAIASAGDELAAIMRRAGFRYIFLGIENVLDADLAFLRAAAKNASRKDGRTVGSATMRAIDVIHRHGMAVVGGLIVGNPDDTPDSIEANLTFARQHVDWPYIQHPTPYPGTPMTKDFRERSLVVNDNVDEYDGTTAVVRSASMSADDIEFLRWRAERWMKLRHLPSVMLRYPGFVARHWPAMLRHTFRGSSWRTWMGLESEREAFHRYKEIRRREREFFPPPSRQDTPPSSFTWRRSWS
jgi:anaerobic magnesium-protoporphyrin IX monomethyl ester cyclase